MFDPIFSPINKSSYKTMEDYFWAMKIGKVGYRKTLRAF
jgi:hypothetical protein